VDEQGRHLWKPVSNGAPNLFQAIDDEIAGDRSGGKKELEFILLRQENAIRGEGFLWLKIMVQGFDDHP